MLASVTSATLLGVEGQVVTVEVHVSPGLPSYTVVGLPDPELGEGVCACIILREGLKAGHSYED